MREESEAASSEAPLAPEIENIIIIDRSVDLVTPMLTQVRFVLGDVFKRGGERGGCWLVVRSLGRITRYTYSAHLTLDPDLYPIAPITFTL